MTLQFLALTDLHHQPEVFPHDAPAFLRKILARGKDAGASFAIQLGDFLHDLPPNGWLADEYAAADLPTYNVFGNHDTDRDEMGRILEMYRLERTEKIRIEGTMGDYITPVSREELLRVDQRRLSDERLCSPSVRSYEVDLTRGSVTVLK